ncbi:MULTISPECIES: Y-family DNA polymerase [Roseomonadaceae]|uniref:Y-family DNA polymerase n=1 Tax=Roseomonadaceae TaxID=3385906 RepID=UPI001E536076|nr:DNA polymerase Y family protein [Roseomonas oleicola]
MTAPRRYLALHLPAFATDRLRRAEPDLPQDVPLAIWASQGPRRLLSAVDLRAWAAGLRPGQALADAQAIAPDLLLRPADPEGDLRLLEGLALWARRYTPLAALDAPDGLLLDITGCDHLWGGEAALLAEAQERLWRAGFAVRGAVAGAAATAGALARAHGDGPVAPSGAEAEWVGPLSIAPALRLDPALLEQLGGLGLMTVADLLRLPRPGLARRFGVDLLDRLDALAGRRHAPLRPVLSPPDLGAARDLVEPIITRTAIDALLDRLLDQLCAKLRAAGRGARQVVLMAWRVDGAVQEVAIGTGTPLRAPAHLRHLFRDRLERLEPGLGFERMALEARVTEPMSGGLQSALAIGGRRDEAAAQLLAQLLDRLRQRVKVRRLAPRDGHWPERSVAALPLLAPMPEMPVGWVRPDAPVLLLRRPQPIEVVALLPDDPPALLRWRNRPHPVLRAEGPRRLEPEWWRGPGVARDYHQVALASGARLWLFRAGPPEAARWMLHGHLP